MNGEQLSFADNTFDKVVAMYVVSVTQNPKALIEEMDRLEKLIEAKNKYKNNLISINEFIRRLMMNNIYDEINMGTENFVVIEEAVGRVCKKLTEGDPSTTPSAQVRMTVLTQGDWDGS